MFTQGKTQATRNFFITNKYGKVFRTWAVLGNVWSCRCYAGLLL